MTKKFFYALLICLTLILASVPKVLSSNSQVCNYNSSAYQGLEIENLAQELTSTGLIGRIHGAAGATQMFVMSVREPDNFFSHREFSLIPTNTSTSNQLRHLNRHDLVCVQGKIIANPSPQQHISLDSIHVLDSWSQPPGFKAYEREINLPAELKQQTNLIGKIHAIGENGKILVMGYKDMVLPIYAENPKDTRNLYRGDIIELSYQIQEYPNRPIHLQLDSQSEQPIKVLDAIADLNNQPQKLTGKLVKFPQSPQLKFDVYAIEVDTQGIKRYFTLINFEDMTEFQNIRSKLAQIWDDNVATAISGRNMLINPQVNIEATGLGNIISPEQANPQILLQTAQQVRQIS